GIYTWSLELGTGSVAHMKATFTGVKESLGYEPAELPSELGATVELLVIPADRGRVLAELQAHLDGDGDRYESEYRIRHKDGSVHWTLARGVAVRDAGGRPVRVMGTSVDVTRIKEAEEAARKSKEHLEVAMELGDFTMSELDLRGPPASWGMMT